ncbi:hypothetical protein QBC39DRAFT_396533 [Podospora conica]|nr:hypothetical protein QBC39DRAFT_396533 [Schizothecium conicum]
MAESTRHHFGAAVEASLNSLVFDMGRLAIPPDTTIIAMLRESFTKITNIYSLPDPQSLLVLELTLPQMLHAIFDTASLSLVTASNPSALAHLDDRERASLFTQAVGGLATMFQRLHATRAELTPSVLLREMQLFAESDQRRNMMDKIGASPIMTSCYTKGVLADFVMATIEDRETGHFENLPLGRLGQEALSDSVAWVSARPCKTNGLPWGFTILALN